MNPWTRRPLTHNPYYRTAFRVAGVSRETTARRTLVLSIGETRKMVGKTHVVNGELVSEAELHAAEAILLDPRQRMTEELLGQAAERLPLDPARELAREAAAAMQADLPERLPVDNLSGWLSWARDLARRFLEQTPSPSPSLGALELTLAPPFGQAEDH